MVQEEDPWVVQGAVMVEQEVVQEEAVLAWEVLVSEKGEQTVGELVAVKKQMCHQKEIPLYAVFVTAFLLQNHQNHLHHRPLKIPLLPDPPQGFPDLKEILNQVNGVNFL